MPRWTPSPKHKWLSLPDNWDDCWQTAKLASSAGANTATITVVGDSISNGQQASDWMNKSYFELLRASLTSAYPLWADFWPQFAYSSLPSGASGSLPWGGILNGHAHSNFTNNGFCGMEFQNDTGNTDFQTFTAPYACTDMDILYEDLNAGTWKYNVDGGAQQTITDTGNNSTANTIVKKIALTGLSNTAHTLTHGNYSVALMGCIQGITTYKSARTGPGLGFGRCATSGISANDYDRTGFPSNRVELYQGKTPQQDGTNNTGFGFPLQPHLAILELGVNDCSGGISIATYEKTLDRFIQAFRRGQPAASILILAPWFGNGLSTDCAPTQSNGTVWNQYLQVMQSLAAAYSCAFLNIHAKWGSNPLAQGFVVSSTNLHPSDAGHADIANSLIPIL